MLKIFLNKKWESLIEIMIAVVILTIVLISMSKILWNSKITAQSSEKRIEAVSLAKEWLEIFRYYRKYNYMQYSDKKRICWNFLEDNWNNISDARPHIWADWVLTISDKKCEESSEVWKEWSANHILIDDKIYIPAQNISDENYWRFYLTSMWKDLVSSWNKKNDWQIFKDLENFQLCKELESWLIMSCESMWLKSLPDDKKEKLPYFRSLKIEYVDSFWVLCSDTSTDCDPLNPKSLNQIKVTSSVVWPVWPWVQSVDLTTIFTDYEDRTDRDS